MKTEMFGAVLGDKGLQATMMDFHRLLQAPSQPDQVDLEQVFAQTIDQLELGDAEFTDNFKALSEEERRTLKEEAMKAVDDALKGKGLDFDGIRKDFLTASYDCQIKGNDFFVTREGETLLHLTNLNTVEGIAAATWIQIASIIVEAVCLVMSIVGAVPKPGSKQIGRAAEAIAEKVARSSVLQRAVARVAEAFRSGSRWSQAQSIFLLIKDVNAVGLVKTIVKILLKDMKWYEYALMVIKMVAYIVAAVMTDGVALIAKLIIILGDAVAFAIKLTNLDRLNAMVLATT
jgi:hypothetical protein